MRFIGTKRFSPVIYENDMPSRESPLYRKWWLEQARRCIHGYKVVDSVESGDGDVFVDGVNAIWTKDKRHVYLPDYGVWIKDRTVHITGKHYWYLNFWNIYGTDSKTNIKGIIHPKFIDVDYEKAIVLEKQLRDGKDNLDAKARQKGFSEWYSSVIGWFFTFVQGCQLLIIAGENRYSEHTMENTIRGLDLLNDTEFYKHRSPNKVNEYVRSAYTEIVQLPNGKKLQKLNGFQSKIYCLTAKDNPQVASRLSPLITIFEEAGIWKKGELLETSEYIKASQYAENKKTGWSCYIATGGEMETSVDDIRKMFYNPEQYDLLSFKNIYEDNDGGLIAHFTPEWKYRIIDSDGNSKKMASLKAIDIDRKNQKDSEKRYRMITQHPNKPSELFMISGGGYFGESIVLKMNERLQNIVNHRSLQLGFEGNWIWIDPMNKRKGVYWTNEPDAFGMKWFWKLEDPYKEHDTTTNSDVVPNGLYKQGTDSYDKDSAPNSTSLGSSHVIKGFHKNTSGYGTFVCRLVGRPTEEMGGAMYFYDLVMRMNVAYNTENLIEYSNLRIFHYYEQNNMQDYLAVRPDFVISNWVKLSKTQNKYGIDPNTKIYWLKALRDFFIDNNFAQIENLYNQTQIRSYINFKLDANYNCDETISSALCIVQLEEEKAKMANTEYLENEDSSMFFEYTEDENGSIIYNDIP
jgi:hypothetical protein